MHYYEHGRIGSFVVTDPLVLGHEASGVVEAVGSAVTRLSVGDRVSLEPGVPDLSCPECLVGRYNLCEDMKFHATPPYDGSFAEYVAHHELFAHQVSDRISDDAAALLEPVSVALWACQKGGVTAGSRVLVTGVGPVGLLVVQVARALGAAEVTASDVNEQRLELAQDDGRHARPRPDGRHAQHDSARRADRLLGQPGRDPRRDRPGRARRTGRARRHGRRGVPDADEHGAGTGAGGDGDVPLRAHLADGDRTGGVRGRSCSTGS